MNRKNKNKKVAQRTGFAGLAEFVSNLASGIR